MGDMHFSQAPRSYAPIHRTLPTLPPTSTYLSTQRPPPHLPRASLLAAIPPDPLHPHCSSLSLRFPTTRCVIRHFPRHAPSQGDGEVSFCGAIEMSGFLELKVSVIKGGMKLLPVVGPSPLSVNPIFEIGPMEPRYSEYLVFEGVSVDEQVREWVGGWW